jgi:DHA2 family metal-tetracycline-proton antiporter-like MFS transporter/DHA2 family florfenicol/chloramphenicol resistance protein-like MFS transporter
MVAGTGSTRRSTRLMLGVVVVAILISVLNQTFTNVVVPDIRQDFGVSQGQAGWVITGYLLVFAVGIPLYGRIADLYSLRRVFSTGLVVLAAGSLLCGFAPTLPLLVVGRIIQAVGAAAIPAIGFASIAKTLPSGERGGALGLLSASVGAGAAIGPVLGGAAAGLTGWQVLFYLTAVFCVILIPAALRVLPGPTKGAEGKKGAGRLMAAIHRFDVPGGLSLALAAGFALFAVTEGQVMGFGSPVVWTSFGLAALGSVGFVWRVRRAPEPFVSPALFKNAGFLAGAGVGFFMMFCNLGSLVLAPLMLSEINDLSAGQIGLVLAPGAAAVAILSPFAGRLSDRLGPRTIIIPGLVVVLVSTLLLATFGAGASSVIVAACILGQGLGFAAINSPNANAVTAVLPPAQSGVGLGIYQMLFFLGGGFGPAVAATFLGLRQDTGSGPLIPAFDGSAWAYSDSFLLLAGASVIALFSASRIGTRKKAA